MMKVIYLASPYTDEDKTVMENRYQLAIDGCAKIMRMGLCPISPIVHSHPIANKHNLGMDFDAWEEIDYELISRCDEFWILHIEGVHKSKGVKKELGFALSNNKPIRTLVLEEDEV